MSLEEVGKQMGIDKTAISRIERGLTPYDQIHLQQMSEIYRATISDLLYTTRGGRLNGKPVRNGWVSKRAARDKKARRRTPADELTEMFAKLKLPEESTLLK